jgi:aminopeptidase N
MKHLIAIALLCSLLSCHSSKPIVFPSYTIDNEWLDTLVVRAEKIEIRHNRPSSVYRPSSVQSFDLLHTRLNLKLNWEERSVSGVARLKMKPYFYPASTVVLDAVNFDISRILLVGEPNDSPLQHEYDGKKLRIQLDRPYYRDEELEISIEYKAFPERGASEQAYLIGSDQGLFFIDPANTHPGKPTQVWTQGQTQYNSRWFPTFDQPNERCTQDLYITVADSLVTLSNGILANREIHLDGTRTDHWKLELPHAPYLFALVVGEYAVVADSWNGLDLEYYVYPEYEKDARSIFNHTPEMLSFFSELTGIPYPWPKYSQVIVSDFVSGAMENTTAVIFSEGFQKCREDLVDFPNDLIVAHELSHHWFGNLVTCESWANLTLNEGFANYAEYLWTDHKYGVQAAELHRFSEQQQYLQSARNHTRPLIDFEYRHRDELFDFHSYNKGGLILHMLRLYLGDEAFFTGMNRYLNRNMFGSVEAHDLRLVMESISGEDLNWFFNQWFFDKGHPVLEAHYQYSDSLGAVSIELNQVQDSSLHRSVFRFPLSVRFLYPDGEKQDTTIWMNHKRERFILESKRQPEVVLFNAGNELLGEINTAYTPGEWAFIFQNDEHIVNQYLAISVLSNSTGFVTLFEDALGHENWQIRSIALQNLPATWNEHTISRLKTMLAGDDHPLIRTRVFRYLEMRGLLDEKMVLSRMEQDSSASVLSYSLDWLDNREHPLAEKMAVRYLDNPSHSIEIPVAGILAKSGRADYLAYFENRLFRGNTFFNNHLLDGYSRLLSSLPEDLMIERCSWLNDQIRHLPFPERRYYSQVIQQQLEQLEWKVQERPTTADQTGQWKKHLDALRKLMHDQDD